MKEAPPTRSGRFYTDLPGKGVEGEKSAKTWCKGDF